MVATSSSLIMSICRSWWSIHQKLRLVDVLELDVFIDSTCSFVEGACDILSNWCILHIELLALVEEVLGRSRLTILSTRNQQRRIVILNIC